MGNTISALKCRFMSNAFSLTLVNASLRIHWLAGTQPEDDKLIISVGLWRISVLNSAKCTIAYLIILLRNQTHKNSPCRYKLILPPGVPKQEVPKLQESYDSSGDRFGHACDSPQTWFQIETSWVHGGYAKRKPCLHKFWKVRRMTLFTIGGKLQYMESCGVLW